MRATGMAWPGDHRESISDRVVTSPDTGRSETRSAGSACELLAHAPAAELEVELRPGERPQRRLTRMMRGADIISLRGYDLLADAIDVGQQVIPVVREEVARRDAAAAPRWRLRSGRAGGAGYQWPWRMTSATGRRLGRASGLRGRSAG
jgi:hypothetical protein